MATNWKPSGFMNDQVVEVTMAVGTQSQTATLAKYGKAPRPFTRSVVDIYPMGQNDSFSAGFLPPDPFLNAVKMMNITDSALQNNITNVDANGNPLEVPAGHTYVILFAETSPNTTKSHAGTYKFRWKSTQDLNISAHLGATVTNVTWDGTDGSADVVFPSGNQGVRIARPDNLAGVLDIREVELVHQKNAHDGTSYQAHLDAGKVWNPDYLQWWTINGKRPGMVRAMIWNSVNFWRTNVDSSHVRPLSYSKWYSRTPPEVVGAFANEVNPEYLWVCVPLMADASYITDYATKIKNTITTNTIVIYELSNELWGFGFSQTPRLLMEGVIFFAENGGVTSAGASLTNGSKTVNLGVGEGVKFANGDPVAFGKDQLDAEQVDPTSGMSGDVMTLKNTWAGATGTYTAYKGSFDDRIPMQSKMSEDMRQVLETVYAGTDSWKFETVLAGQAVSTGDFIKYLTTPIWKARFPWRPDPAERHEWQSISSYYGSGGMSTAIADKWELPDEAGALLDLHNSLINTHIPALSSNWVTFKAHLAANAPKMKSMAYEGGPHYVFGSDALAIRFTPIWEAYRNNATYMPLLIDAWAAVEIANSDGPFHQFQLFGSKASDGISWPILHNMDGTTDEFGTALRAKADATAVWY